MTESAPANVLISLSEARQQAACAVTQTLRGAPAPVSEMTSHLTAAQGKGIRSLLLIYCSMDAEGLVPQDAVQAAAAVELFHLATLVHDDVIDDAPLRRGIPTIQYNYGKKRAVICGDYLLCLAASKAAPLHTSYQGHSSLLATYMSALSRVCQGELNQFVNNRNLELGIPGYLRIIMGKTASLFYASALSGALIARYTQAQALRLARFGRYLGIVFQIVDDCKDYEFSEGVTLKTGRKDIAEGVVTLPLICAFRSSPELRELAGQAFDNASAAELLVMAVRDSGGIRQSRELAVRFADKAKSMLAGFPEEKKRLLLELLESLTNHQDHESLIANSETST